MSEDWGSPVYWEGSGGGGGYVYGLGRTGYVWVVAGALLGTGNMPCSVYLFGGRTVSGVNILTSPYAWLLMNVIVRVGIKNEGLTPRL